MTFKVKDTSKRLLVFIAIVLSVGFFGLLLDQIDISKYISSTITDPKLKQTFASLVSAIKAPLFTIVGFASANLIEFIKIYLSKKEAEAERSPHISIMANKTYAPRRSIPSKTNTLVPVCQELRTNEHLYVSCTILNQGKSDVLHLCINGFPIAVKALPNTAIDFTLKLPYINDSRGSFSEKLLVTCQSEINEQYSAEYLFTAETNGSNPCVSMHKGFIREERHDKNEKNQR